MSKRDDDADLGDVGMTTAERRRRRRRGALRVPSDNVPRSRTPTSPPVVAPVPEDPALAMSIAYSFGNEAPEQLSPPLASASPTRAMFEDSRRNAAAISAVAAGLDPIAPDAVATVIDPPSSPVEQADFEMKTREMAAVDLEALGLEARNSQAMPASTAAPRSTISVIVDDELKVTVNQPSRDPKPSTPPPRPPVLPTGSAVKRASVVADADVDVDVSIETTSMEAASSNEDDIETTTISAVPEPPPLPAQPPQPVAPSLATTQVVSPPPVPSQTPTAKEAPSPRAKSASASGRERLRTMALTEDDLEEVMEAARASTRPGTSRSAAPAPGEDGTPATQPLTELDVEATEAAPAERGSGEIDIDVDSSESAPMVVLDEASDRSARPSVPPPVASRASPPPPRAGTAPLVPAPERPGKRDDHGAERREFDTPKTPPPPPAAKVDAMMATPPAPPPTPAAAAPPPPPPAATDQRRHAPPTPPPPTKKVATTPQQAVAAAASGKSRDSRGKPWFVDLFDDDYLRTLPFLTPQATQSEAEFVIETMGLSPGAQLLDVGCGYGRHAMELAARGYHVVGLDLSTSLLVRGGEEANRRNLSINFVRGDMRELDFDSQFDGAYCLFSTFGYFDDETNKKTLVNIARALRPGGRVLVEILNRDYVIADLPTRVWWEGDGCVVLEEVDLNYFSSRIQVNRSVVFDDGRQLEQEISLRAYSLHEVGKLMHAAGFRVLEVSGGYQTRGRFFGNQSRHIIVLAERKDPTGSTTGLTSPAVPIS